MTHATITKSIPLVWEDAGSSSWSRHAYLTEESITALKKLFIDAYGEDFANILRYTKDGVEVRSYDCEQIGRQKAGVITAIKTHQSVFDFSIQEKKYEEMARIFKDKQEAQKKRAEYTQVMSDFCATVNVENVDVEDYMYRKQLQVDGENVLILTDDDGNITRVSIQVPRYNHGTFSEIIVKMQKLQVTEMVLQATLIGKNIYTK